ncbi:hypothetical protein E2C01_006214 [Portunus trituberculatus]|uniref:Uncharacterized protein n=1 Tax=Portunus trituberculatus TaxID=210409 RepID=A0A5B7CUI8_PORTR|nr:hypothetical protein [Portunus trituberculatus]
MAENTTARLGDMRQRAAAWNDYGSRRVVHATTATHGAPKLGFPELAGRGLGCVRTHHLGGWSQNLTSGRPAIPKQLQNVTRFVHI